MNLFSLPTDHFIANLLGVMICIGIMIACVCRINLLETRRWRLSLEQVMLLAFAFWAAGTLADLWRGADIGFHGAAGGLGIVVYLIVSYHHWHLQQALIAEAKDREAFQRRSELHVSVEEAEDRHAASTRC